MFQVRDLPEGLSGVSVHFALAAPAKCGSIDVQVFDLEFSDNERIELSKLIALAEYKRASGEVADCLRILEGYWPRFLASYVPRPAIPLATAARRTRETCRGTARARASARHARPRSPLGARLVAVPFTPAASSKASAGEQMEMQMVDGLAGVGSAVDHDAIAARKAQLFSQAGG